MDQLVDDVVASFRARLVEVVREMGEARDPSSSRKGRSAPTPQAGPGPNFREHHIGNGTVEATYKSLFGRHVVARLLG